MILYIFAIIDYIENNCGCLKVGPFDDSKNVSKLFKDADILIKNKEFDLALDLINDAKSIDPTNCYIQAFVERIEYFKNHLTVSPCVPATVAVSDRLIDHIKSTTINNFIQDSENDIKSELDSDYKVKFNEEIKNIELSFLKKLEDQKLKYETEINNLKITYEDNIYALENKYEKDFLEKLDLELLDNEERLKKQFRAEQSFIENEIKSRLEKEYKSKIDNIKNGIQEEANNLLNIERQALEIQKSDLEKKYREILEQEINKVKNENNVSNSKHIELIKSNLEKEYKDKYFASESELKHKFEIERKTLNKFLLEKQKELETNYHKTLSEELQKAKNIEDEELSAKLIEIEKRIKIKLTEEFELKLETEKENLKQKYLKDLEAEYSNITLQQELMLEQDKINIENIRSAIKQEMDEKFLTRMEKLKEQFTKEYDHKLELLGTSIPQKFEDKIKFYKTRLREFWINGQPTLENVHKILQLKELFEFSFEEHTELELDVRLEIFTSKVEEIVRFSKYNTRDKIFLEQLKSKYLLTHEEESLTESFILNLYAKSYHKGLILFVDDDEILLKVVEEELTQENYKVITAIDVADALDILENNVVDLIISDLKFPDAQLDGMSFFNVIQKYQHLKNIPFIMMSSFGDGGIVRSGIQLGIDDYLTKPVDMELLKAVVEGKLKRYKCITTQYS